MRGLSRTRGRAARPMLMAAACAALGLATGLAPRPAQAQVFDWGNVWPWGNQGNEDGWGSEGWPPRSREPGEGRPGMIYRLLSERGFRIVAPLRRNGDVVVADVIDRRGRRERLILASTDGQILQRYLLNAQPMPRRAPQQPDDFDQMMERSDRSLDPAPVPPANIPYPRYGEGSDGTLVEPLRPRSSQRITIRPPAPRYVERTPDTAQPEGVPLAPDDTPVQPVRPKVRPNVAARPLNPVTPQPAVTASRPADPAPAQTSPAAPTTGAPAAALNPPSTRMRDPLAIPRAEPNAAAKPSVAAAGEAPRKPLAVPANPAASPAKPVAAPKTGDVPVAPLD